MKAEHSLFMAESVRTDAATVLSYCRADSRASRHSLIASLCFSVARTVAIISTYLEFVS